MRSMALMAVMGFLILVTPSLAAEPSTAPAQPASASTGGIAATTTAVIVTPVDPSTPKGALKSLAAALDAGNRADILALLDAKSDTDRRIAASMADLATANAGLRKVAVQSFGEKDARPLGVDPAATSAAMNRIDIAAVTLDGDKATLVSAEADGPPMTLVKHGDRWLLPVSELSKGVEPADLDRNLRDAAEQTRLLIELTGEVTAGKYKTAVDARQMLDQRILKSAMPQQQPEQPAAGATTRP